MSTAERSLVAAAGTMALHWEAAGRPRSRGLAYVLVGAVAKRDYEGCWPEGGPAGFGALVGPGGSGGPAGAGARRERGLGGSAAASTQAHRWRS
jgi:hypothetical protein